MSEMNNANDVLLSVKHLKQHFKMGRGTVKAVDDISFDIRRGEVFGLVGESGCGKTTTGRSIIRLYDITGGEIEFEGKKIGIGTADMKAQISVLRKEGKTAEAADLEKYMKESVAEVKANVNGKDNLMTKIQMIFQDPIASLNPRMTVREIIAEGLIIKGEKRKEVIDKAVAEVLEMVGLVSEHAERYPHEFSGGQRQRIGIARAIVLHPELIIADEPISALDVSIQAQVINLMNELRREMGLTILFIAHDLSVVKYFSDRIAVMYYGKIVELASSEELFAHPTHPYTKALLSAIPLPDPNYEKQRKRSVYIPSLAHDYSKEQPTLRELYPDHFVLCNTEEAERYLKEANESL